MVQGLIVKAVTKVLYAFLAEKVLVALVFRVLTELAKKSDNTVDDKLIQDVSDAYYGRDVNDA